MPVRHRFKDKFLVTRCKCQIYFALTPLQKQNRPCSIVFDPTRTKALGK